MVHYVLATLLLFAVSALSGALAWALLEVYEATERGRRRRRREAGLAFGRYAAEQAIRETERRAIQDILAVYHHERDSTGEVIEGTAVEVKR